MEFWLTIFIFPVASFIIGVMSGMFKRPTYRVSMISFAIWIIISLFIFGKDFVIWGTIYTLLVLSGNSLVLMLE